MQWSMQMEKQDLWRINNRAIYKQVNGPLENQQPCNLQTGEWYI